MNGIRIKIQLAILTLIIVIDLLGCVVTIGDPPVIPPVFTPPDWVIERTTFFNQYNLDYAPLLTSDSTGNVYLVDAYLDNFSLSKFTASGTLQWEKIIDANYMDLFKYSRLGAMILDGEHLYLLWMSATDAANWDTDWVIAKYDTQGNMLWQTRQTIPGGGHDLPYGMRLGDNGLLYVYGYNDPDRDKLGDAFLVIAAYDLQGNQVWQDTNKIGIR